MTTAIVTAKRTSLALATASALITAAFTLAGAATALAAASGSPQGAAACVPGLKKINGVSARTFCGPAKATVKMNGQTISYRGGNCSKSLGLFSVNIGTVVLGNLRNKPEYFGLTARAKAGTQTRQGVSVVHAGKSNAIIGTVTIKAGLRAGTFSGKVFGSPKIIAGSFTC
jgi:hypothetical protein